MAKAEKERINHTLNFHLSNIHETLQVLDLAPPSSMEPVSWEDVVKMSEQVSKQATIVGVLWTGETPQAKSVEENMETFFNTLQGLLLLYHASLVGSSKKDIKLLVPQLVGAVWESCSALKKTPATNITAIGRAMTQVAVSVKDVLREMKDLRPESSNSTIEESDGTSKTNSNHSDNDHMSDDDLGNDLSPEEMKVAQLASGVVLEAIVVIKELIRTITTLLKQEKPADSGSFVNSLELLLKQCQEIGLQIDELGACLYPPQEIPAIKAALGKISDVVSKMEAEVESLKSSPGAFFQACNGLKSSVKQMGSGIESLSTSEIEAKLQDVSINKSEE
ncbi:hypothetical protein Tsubulata_039332 [Turnera subulata]|uniref:Cyclin-D1-binding protein 1 n=1 Tax=Turnera subulata TaxID=218843 RepID=A0A9Q0J6U9_9ROSI|nr:hypothetical protein Tsubulata_039332 [Turnera subulata]